MFSLRTLSRPSIRYFSSCPAHGGILTSNMVPASDHASIVDACNVSIDLSERQSCDVELLMNGGFSPLDGFMNSTTYNSVVDTMRLPSSNLLFGLPVVLDTDRDDITPGQKVLLKFNGENIATLDVDELFTPDKPKETLQCYGTSSIEHPGVRMVAMERGKHYLGGKVTGLNIPQRIFPCQTPGWLVVCFIFF